jgi:hypothetical protein
MQDCLNPPIRSGCVHCAHGQILAVPPNVTALTVEAERNTEHRFDAVEQFARNVPAGKTLAGLPAILRNDEQLQSGSNSGQLVMVECHRDSRFRVRHY